MGELWKVINVWPAFKWRVMDGFLKVIWRIRSELLSLGIFLDCVLDELLGCVFIVYLSVLCAF